MSFIPYKFPLNDFLYEKNSFKILLFFKTNALKISLFFSNACWDAYNRQYFGYLKIIWKYSSE